MKKRIITWLYRLQQRISITNAEFSAVLVLFFLLLVGFIARYIQSRPPTFPADIYERDDRLFEEGTRSLDAAMAVMSDTVQTEDDVSKPPEYDNGAVQQEETVLRLNLNTATAKELEQLPRIGETKAVRIVTYRNTHGPFKHVEDLVLVQGIGEKTMALLKPYIFVE